MALRPCEDLDGKRTALEQAKLRFDWGTAARLQYEVSELERQVRQAIDAQAKGRGNGAKLVKKEVDAEDVAAVVSAWTGIPLTRLMQGEADKLVHMEESLRQRVVGQDEAIAAVANAVRTAPDPDGALMAFLQSTYEAAADLGKWDRASLECAPGEVGRPRPV